MKILSHGSIQVAVLFIIAGAPTIQPQERVAIRLVPFPNQVVRFQMTQETDMDLLVWREGQTDTLSTKPVKMLGKWSFGFTQKTGTADDQGHMDAEITYDQLRLEQSMNGKPLEIVDNPGEQLLGKTITLVFDKDSRIVDVRIPQDVNLPADALKEMLASMYGNLPSSPMAVGETATMPFSMDLPMIVAPGNESANLDGRTTYKLISLEKEGEDRLAKVEQTVEASLVKTIGSDSQTKVKLDFVLKGAGSLQLDLDKGLLKSGQMQTTINGKMTTVGDTPNVKSQSIELHGTTKMTSSGSN